ncbi:hypothetical protein QMK17_11185 [Rhodococcus sp. G-MC3]|uniref:hypothetical protein n=1 Tax=Rhodococcus sp. G-MC3 TaxID=3046209 RepID=UPI0024B8BB68|nr:hypothetical protein [Rhodococcus sp. G-MC3]MDJ0393895.1 hypothetical protein [Rhodococcus sp. G-MC3]
MDRTRTTRLWPIAIVIAVAATALIVTLVVRPGKDDGIECSLVAPSLNELIVSRPSAGPLQYLMSVAEEVALQGEAKAYEHYYAVAMQFSTMDGSTHEGVWEVGTNSPDPEGGTVSVQIPVDGAAESIISINGEAQSFTLWPREGAIVDPLSEAVIRARTCLMEFTTATL